jgi:hypothetical protein
MLKGIQDVEARESLAQRPDDVVVDGVKALFERAEPVEHGKDPLPDDALVPGVLGAKHERVRGILCMAKALVKPSNALFSQGLSECLEGFIGLVEGQPVRLAKASSAVQPSEKGSANRPGPFVLALAAICRARRPSPIGKISSIGSRSARLKQPG